MSTSVNGWFVKCVVFLCGIHLLLNTEIHGETFDVELDGPNVCKILEKYKYIFENVIYNRIIFDFIVAMSSKWSLPKRLRIRNVRARGA